MKNEIKGGKNITFVFCAIIYIEIFTFLDHKEIVHTHDGIIFCYWKCGAKFSDLTFLPVLWNFPVWGTRKICIKGCTIIYTKTT